METIAGEFDLYTLQWNRAQVSQSVSDNFNSGYSNAWNYSDGAWAASNGTSNITGWGKRVLGNAGWADYTVEVDIQCPAAGGNAGLIFRVKNPANGLADNDPRLGTDFYQGYYAGIQPTGIQLGRQNYNWKELGFKSQALNAGQWYKLRVVLKGANIKIYLNDMNVPAIDYFDTKPFLAGKAGLRAFNTTVSIDNFNLIANDAQIDCNGTSYGTASVDVCGNCTGGATGKPVITDPAKCMVTGMEPNNSTLLSLRVYPNPSREQFRIELPGDFSYVLFDLTGKEIEQGKSSGYVEIGQGLDLGMYMIRVSNNGQDQFVKVVKE